MSGKAITAMAIALALPGAGHFYLGRRRRAAAFFGIVIVMFTIGLLIEGKVYTPEKNKPLTMLASVASMGVGVPYFIARSIRPLGEVLSITFEHGTAFTLTAGLMNLLLVLDAFDIAERRKP
ncbi:MAG TPA: DUF6677 family protein [Thermoanaerobaculia bacterium]|nr:DUF6677 family protein [Thermoanaerobaculia bacterium]